MNLFCTVLKFDDDLRISKVSTNASQQASVEKNLLNLPSKNMCQEHTRSACM